MEDRRANARVVTTYQDYLELPEDGKRHEVLDGDLRVTPAPSPRHSNVISRLNHLLSEWVHNRDLGWVFCAPCDVVLDETNVLQPDIVFVSKARIGIVGPTKLSGAPDLVVEVLSPSTARYDRTDKLRTYEKHGVSSYWIVDFEQNALEERVLVAEAYVLRATLTGAAIFRPQVLPGFVMDLGRVWPPA